MLEFTIKDFFGIDYDAQSADIVSSKQNTHRYVLNYVTRKLRNLAGIEESPELLSGYESITFDNLVFTTEFVVEGFTDEVDSSGCEYYALAA